ncbi:hypothetical protein LBMAG55_08780 [Verrucomicrobiota bacterium]|nr:hypothetical protein LBMAG55_08780 [Verrucomicrobiota bacterium]
MAALTELALSGKEPLGRIHALWTLEGLGALDAKVVRAFLTSPDARLRAQGLRAGESLVKTGDKALIEDFRKLAADPAPTVVLQAIMTAKYLGSNEVKAWPDSAKFVQTALMTSPSKGGQGTGSRELDRDPSGRGPRVHRRGKQVAGQGAGHLPRTLFLVSWL